MSIILLRLIKLHISCSAYTLSIILLRLIKLYCCNTHIKQRVWRDIGIHLWMFAPPPPPQAVHSNTTTNSSTPKKRMSQYQQPTDNHQHNQMTKQHSSKFLSTVDSLRCRGEWQQVLTLLNGRLAVGSSSSSSSNSSTAGGSHSREHKERAEIH